MPIAQHKFTVGDQVRVRPSVMDPNFPDMPLGGWAGAVSEIQVGPPALFLVKWSLETLAQIHPVFRTRTEGHGLDTEAIWLLEGDLEPDPGGPLKIVYPTKIVPRPHTADDDIDRIRMVFGLTTDDLLPDVDETSLKTYYKYLASRLAFPFEAHWMRLDPFVIGKDVTVLDFYGKLAPIDPRYGLLCEAMVGKRKVALPLAEMENAEGQANCQFVQDYADWYWNWQPGSEIDIR